MATASRKITEIRRRRVQRVLPILKECYPKACCSLDHASPLELLVATILSAQCTDARVNIVTSTLFKKYRSPADYVAATAEELEKDVQSTGFYRNKAKSIRAMAARLISEHDGAVPDSMDALTRLAGVGRKTANVVLGNAFRKNVGVTVDTHVSRVSHRLGLSAERNNAVKIEAELIPIVPQAEWTLWSHLLIAHGRALCVARRPKCEPCPLLADCPAGPKLIKAGETAG